MLLVIDVGNTQTLIGIYQGIELTHHWRASTNAERTADEHALLVAQFLDLADLDVMSDVKGMAGSSGGARITAAIRDMSERWMSVPTVVIEPGTRTGMPILYENPKEVGADRIANAVAAYDLYGGPTIVVDFGTATTFDAVSARGEYLGGAIIPGIEVSVDALGDRGAQLRRVEIAKPRSVIGKNTVEALQSGILYGFAGQVDGVVERMTAELAEDPADVTVMATGGPAPLRIAAPAAAHAH